MKHNRVGVLWVGVVAILVTLVEIPLADWTHQGAEEQNLPLTTKLRMKWESKPGISGQNEAIVKRPACFDLLWTASIKPSSTQVYRLWLKWTKWMVLRGYLLNLEKHTHSWSIDSIDITQCIYIYIHIYSRHADISPPSRYPPGSSMATRQVNGPKVDVVVRNACESPLTWGDNAVFLSRTGGLVLRRMTS